MRIFSKLAALLIAGTLVTITSPAQEQAIRKKDVPKPILDAFQKSYPNSTIRGYSKETEQGTVVYEIESVDGKVHRDVTYATDGSLVSVEESLTFADLPEPVRNTLAKEYPKAKVSTCEKVMKGSMTRFEVLIARDKERYELVLNPDGTTAKKEKK
jgi:hypothetical protein